MRARWERDASEVVARCEQDRHTHSTRAKERRSEGERARGAGRGPRSSSRRHRPLSPPQVLTGVLLALAGLVQFFECAVVAEPPDCAAAAPGVRDHWLVDAAFYLWLQASREGGGSG